MFHGDLRFVSFKRLHKILWGGLCRKKMTYHLIMSQCLRCRNMTVLLSCHSVHQHDERRAACDSLPDLPRAWLSAFGSCIAFREPASAKADRWGAAFSMKARDNMMIYISRGVAKRFQQNPIRMGVWKSLDLRGIRKGQGLFLAASWRHNQAAQRGGTESVFHTTAS